jgi:hypothetical protein
MGVYESSAMLKQAAKDLNIVWDQTSGVWKDAKSREFEKKFVRELSIQIKKVGTALDSIGPILNKIHSELRG